MNYLKTQADIKRPEMLSFLTAPANDASSTGEVALWTYSLAGNRLGTGNLIRIMATGLVYNGGGLNHTFTLKLYYGTENTAVFSISQNGGSSSPFLLDLTLCANAAANSQRLSWADALFQRFGSFTGSHLRDRFDPRQRPGHQGPKRRQQRQHFHPPGYIDL